MRTALGLGCYLALCSNFYAQAPAAVALKEKTLARIAAITAASSGVTGFAAIDLTTGETFGSNMDVIFPQASSIKIPIMMHAFAESAAGRLDLQRKITLQPADAVGGSGHIRSLLRSGPTTFTVEELITAMIETSDNTATNQVIALVGMDGVNRMLDRLDLRATRLRRIMLDSAAAKRDDENVSSPREMVALMQMLYGGKAVNPQASKRMIEIMKLVEADFRGVIPAGVSVASKPGGVSGVRCETGIVFLERRPFAMSVMSTFIADGENVVKDIARVLFEHYSKLASANRFGHKVW